MYHHNCTDYHTIINLLFIGLLIRTVFAAVIVTVAIWLLLKVGRLVDAYTARMKSLTDNQTLASAYEQNNHQHTLLVQSTDLALLVS